MASKGTRTAVEKSEIITALTQILNEKIDPINKKLDKLDSIATAVDYALEELKRLSELEITVKQMNLDFKKMDQELNHVKLENKMLREKLIKQELFTRKNNLRIWGVTVSKNEDIEEKVLNKLKESGIDIVSGNIERIHFTGPLTQNRQRPIIMKLQSFKDKQAIIDKKSSLRAMGINISDDYPKEVLVRREIIVPTFFKALEVCPELNPKLRVDSFILGGKEYTVDNIMDIEPQKLHPENVFTPSAGGVTAFFTKNSPLSNFFPATFQYDDQQFHSSEQCFIYQKAKLFGDGEAASRILQAHTPLEAKAIGRKIVNFDKKVWAKAAQECMYNAMYGKFSQNNELKDFLAKTKGTELAEANPMDLYWGTGISLRDKSLFHADKWKGKNTAGKILSRVRQTLS